MLWNVRGEPISTCELSAAASQKEDPWTHVSSTLDFPADCAPTTTHCGRSTESPPMAEKVSCSLFTTLIRSTSILFELWLAKRGEVWRFSCWKRVGFFARGRAGAASAAQGDMERLIERARGRLSERISDNVQLRFAASSRCKRAADARRVLLTSRSVSGSAVWCWCACFVRVAQHRAELRAHHGQQGGTNTLASSHMSTL